MSEDSIKLFGTCNQGIVQAIVWLEMELKEYKKEGNKKRERKARDVLKLLNEARDEHNEIARIF